MKRYAPLFSLGLFVLDLVAPVPSALRAMETPPLVDTRFATAQPVESAVSLRVPAELRAIELSFSTSKDKISERIEFLDAADAPPRAGPTCA